MPNTALQISSSAGNKYQHHGIKLRLYKESDNNNNVAIVPKGTIHSEYSGPGKEVQSDEYKFGKRKKINNNT